MSTATDRAEARGLDDRLAGRSFDPSRYKQQALHSAYWRGFRGPGVAEAARSLGRARFGEKYDAAVAAIQRGFEEEYFDFRQSRDDRYARCVAVAALLVLEGQAGNLPGADYLGRRVEVLSAGEWLPGNVTEQYPGTDVAQVVVQTDGGSFIWSGADKIRLIEE